MKKFILGFIIGTVIMILVGKVWWYFMPAFLGGRGAIFEPNPVVSCRDLVKGTSDFGNVEVAILNNGKPEVNLEVDLSTLKPETPPDGAYGWPKRLCVEVTNTKGIVLFKNVPAGTAYLFFNNDAANYVKRFGKASNLIAAIEVKKNETSEKTIELSKI